MALRNPVVLCIGGLALFAAACGADHRRTSSLDRDAEPVVADASDVEPDDEEQKDAAVTTRPDTGAPDTGVAPKDAGSIQPDAQATVDAAALDSAIQADSATQADTGSEPVMDAGSDAATPDAELGDASADDAQTDASVPNPLAGKYAARTLLYARQKSNLGTTPLDLVSKGVLISTVEIGLDGKASEQYCIFEISGDIYSWTAPETIQKLVKTDIALEADGDNFVRPVAAHSVPLSWAPGAVPTGCVAGQLHSSGCLCPESDALPTAANDCRMRDLDGDGDPGAAMYIGISASSDLSADGALVTLNIAAQLGIGWKLHGPAGPKLTGDVNGGFLQTELSRKVSPGIQLEAGPIYNAMCPGALGHIELVKGDFTCADLIEKRLLDTEALELFNLELDGTRPEPSACPDPSCGADSDGDGTKNCQDACPDDATKTTTGICGCGKPDVDTDSDRVLDCNDGCPLDPNKRSPGGCGCGAVDADSDEDQTPDCLDGCALDPLKIAPGLCECGHSDVNTDQDSEPDCRDTCPSNAPKTAPGACGCDKVDTDTDSDGTADCIDACPSNAPKTAPGECGCDKPDTDTDHDGTADCADACPDDPQKKVFGHCGCHVAEVDTDKDGKFDCEETCTADPNKSVPGLCGCGIADTNTDGDGLADCNEECDTDKDKTVPGVCGCGVVDTDSDHDGAADCNETCDSDPNKLAPGVCGCGKPDSDSDGDTVLDCNDGCPSDKDKSAPGTCGCGIADKDLDGNGSIDCRDECPNDLSKVAPGVCGCGVADINTDGDTKLDCQEDCDTDPNKTAPLQCGCGIADTDSDGDGTANCNDACPNNAGKVANTVCGCAWVGPELDSDGDTVLDCVDVCPNDRTKTTSAGICGCGVADTNTDGDSKVDCQEDCDSDPAKLVPGVCGCGTPETNTDGDAAPDCTDECDNDAAKTKVGTCGCGVADTNTDGDTKLDCQEECDADPGKLTPGICGCGVADTDSDSDGTPDCQDDCDANAQLQKFSACGCDVCAQSPLIGTYAVRSNVFSKQTTSASNAHEQTQGINYSIIKVALTAQGTLQLTDRQCWAQTLPNGGTGAYSWSKPAWVQAMPAMVRDLTWNAATNTFTRPAVLTRLGWDPARQPGSCSPSSTPVAGWNNAWGTTCRCTAPASNLPPYDTNVTVNTYDCRLTDTDGDTQPGVTSVGTILGAPAVGSESSDGIVSVYSASNVLDTWSITLDASRKHTATIDDQSQAQLIGCTGLGCGSLPAVPPPSRACPARFNRASFVPVDAGTTCASILSQRGTLWGANPAWPGDAADQCPFPAWQ